MNDAAIESLLVSLREEVRALRDAAATQLGDALIEKTPGVVGGSARVDRTRVPVWSLESHRRLGMNDAEVLACFPELRAVDLVAAGAYVAAHRDEIEQDIRENDED